MTNIIYYDLKTHNIEAAIHACFDEGMNDLEMPMLNISRLRKALGQQLESDTQETTPPEN
eukprot:6889427-Ditylum_brightwellii.AAC.1